MSFPDYINVKTAYYHKKSAIKNMSFISFNFWLVFPFLFFAYWLLPYRFDTLRKLYLIFVSYVIYATFQPVYTLLLAGITISTFLGGGIFGKIPSTQKNFNHICGRTNLDAFDCF